MATSLLMLQQPIALAAKAAQAKRDMRDVTGSLDFRASLRADMMVTQPVCRVPEAEVANNRISL